MYDTIQHILTLFFNAIAIMGFFGIALHAMWKAVCAEVAGWETPHTMPKTQQEKALEAPTRLIEMPKFADPWELEITTSSRRWGTPKSIDQPLIKLLPPAANPEASLSVPPTFQGHSRNKLRKIAKSLKIKGYSRLEVPQLISAITTHLETQEIGT